jgi:hypothetical protein
MEFTLSDFTVTRPYSLHERRARTHQCFYAGAQQMRCSRCGYITTGVKKVLGPDFYLPKHREALLAHLHWVWDQHVHDADARDEKSDRDNINRRVQEALTRLTEADPDPTTAAVMLLSNLTREELDSVGGLPTPF